MSTYHKLLFKGFVFNIVEFNKVVYDRQTSTAPDPSAEDGFSSVNMHSDRIGEVMNKTRISWMHDVLPHINHGESIPVLPQL